MYNIKTSISQRNGKKRNKWDAGENLITIGIQHAMNKIFLKVIVYNRKLKIVSLV